MFLLFEEITDCSCCWTWISLIYREEEAEWMENSGDRKRQGPAVVHCAEPEQSTMQEVIGTGGTRWGLRRLGESTRRSNASLLAATFKGPATLLQGLPIAHSGRELFSLLCPVRLCSATASASP